MDTNASSITQQIVNQSTNFNNFVNSGLDWISSYFLLVLLYAIGIIIVLFILVKILQAGHYRIASRYDKLRREQREADETEDLLDKDFPKEEQSLQSETEMLRNKIKNYRNTKNYYFIPRLRERLAKATERLEVARKNRILEQEIYPKQHKIKILDGEIQAKEYYEKNKNKYILWRLKTDENPVFFKDKLTKEETNALLENGYFSVSEYCIIQNELINVLVKPQLNHSPTHAFLVWNVVKLLEKIEGVTNIREYLTKEADIIFNFKGKIYALEIETGTLLQKKKQLQEKLDDLNKKYPKRWMFIVSNRNLVQKYNKFGVATQRKGVSEKLAKMLGIAHPI